MSNSKPYLKPFPPSFLKYEDDQLKVSVVDYVPVDGSNLRVTLIGAVHVADRSYYQRLDAEFNRHQKVLYEMVRPSASGKVNPILKYLANFAQVAKKLDLVEQKTVINYDRPNFVHADVSGDDLFGKSAFVTGLRLFADLAEIMGSKERLAALSGDKQGIPQDVRNFLGKGSKVDAKKAKKAIGKYLAEGAHFIEGFTVFNKNLVIDRNTAVLEELDRQIAAGITQIGIFYGSGHNADFHTRLLAQYGLKPAGVQWLTAWDMSDHPQVKTPTTAP